MKQPAFIPKPGQVDFTDIRWCPVVNCVVFYKDKFLLVERSSELRLYPGYYNGISGFLDDKKDLTEKVKEELNEELGIEADKILSIKLCGVFDEDAPELNKTWIVHAIKVEIGSDQIKLDWEASHYKWVNKDEALSYKLVPGFSEVINLVLK